MNKFIFSVIALLFVVVGWRAANEKLDPPAVEQKPKIEQLEIAKVETSEVLPNKIVDDHSAKDLTAEIHSIKVDAAKNQNPKVASAKSNLITAGAEKKAKITKDNSSNLQNAAINAAKPVLNAEKTIKKEKAVTATLEPKIARAMLSTKVKSSAVVYFDSEQNSLTKNEMAKIDMLLKDVSTLKRIKLNAYNDSTMSKADSEKISAQRLNNVMSYIKSKGILIPTNADIVENSPALDSNKTAIGRANNRRIEIVLFN